MRVCASAHDEQALGGAFVLRQVPDHLHHQNVLHLQSSLHQHLQPVTYEGQAAVSRVSVCVCVESGVI